MPPSHQEPISLNAEEQDIESFAALQARLPQLWKSIQSGHFGHTSIVVPSLSVDQEELRKIDGAAFYEERLLFTLIRLRHPQARVMYITSQPLHPEIIDYYLQLLVGIPASHARRRLALVSMHDASQEPLTQKILRRPRLLQRIRDWIGNLDRAYLTCFNSTALERKLAVALGIPLNGVDPSKLYWGTKSGSREIFTRAGVDQAQGFNNLESETQVIDALLELRRRRPDVRKAVVKLNAGFSGEGNALFSFPDKFSVSTDERAAIAAQLKKLDWTAPDEHYDRFMGKFAEMGGIVEEFLEAEEVHSPSVQMRISPGGEVIVVSTHEQVLGGGTGQVYLGCRFPADDDYRPLIQREAMKIGTALRDEGIVSRFAIDFLVLRKPGGDWRCCAIEINLRMGGTTHPFLALEFLTGGAIDPENGLFRTQHGEHKFYFSTDNLKSPFYRGLLPEDLMDIVVQHGLHFRPTLETGVLFHMIGSLSQYGKIGVSCIGDSPSEAEDLYRRTVAILDQETGATGNLGGRTIRLLDHRVPRME